MDGDMSTRQQIPSPFYGIYNDDDEDYFGTLTDSEAEALQAAAY
jgi:hypothetical protein